MFDDSNGVFNSHNYELQKADETRMESIGEKLEV